MEMDWSGRKDTMSVCNLSRILVLIVVAGLFMKTAGAVEDKVPRYTYPTIGKGNKRRLEPDAPVFSGEDSLLMITEVRITYFLYNGIKDIKCFDFTYGDSLNHCPADDTVNEKVDTIPLADDEYITEVSGYCYSVITAITLKTNRRTIGPYGVEGGPSGKFAISHREAPLLYAQIAMGVSLYEITLTFHEYPVNELKPLAIDVSSEAYEVLASNVIMDIYEVNANYEHMLFDVARKGCLTLGPINPRGLQACNLQTLLADIKILTSLTSAHMHHLPRNLVPFADYDSKEFLAQVSLSKTFHDLLMEIKFDMQTIIDVTEEQSQQLNAFYSSQTQFDLAIAENDVIYIQGQLDRCKKGGDETADIVGARLTNILGIGLQMGIGEVAEEGFQMGVVIWQNLSPKKLLFGKGDATTIFEAQEDFAEASRNLQTMVYLNNHLEEYTQLMSEIAVKFEENEEQITAMNEIVNTFDTLTDTDEIIATSEEFTQAYGDYTPQVTLQELEYMSALLTAIGEESCNICEETHNMATDVLHLYGKVRDDCLYFPADQAALDSYYEETYSLQFELVNTMTEVVRASVALHMSENIGEVSHTIDIETAAIGSTMVEIQYQTAAQARCDILEYIGAGKRPDVCEKQLYDQADIDRLIAYTGSQPMSTYHTYAYFPTAIQHEPDRPFIDINGILRGGVGSIILPINNTKWLKQYGWLKEHVDPETAFYYEMIEPFIPGLMCNESDKMLPEVFIKVLSAKPQLLYKEQSEPTYTIFQQLVKFSYISDITYCPGIIKEYPVVSNFSEEVVPETKETVCVTSQGIVGDIISSFKDDYTYPSLYSVWNIQVYSADEDCTLVVDPDLGFTPLLTFNLQLREVSVKTEPIDPGIDECWPEGSRCPPDEWCMDEDLGYSCVGSSDIKAFLESLYNSVKSDE